MTYYVTMFDMKSWLEAGPITAKSGYILTVSFAVTILALSLISVQTVSITPGFVAEKMEMASRTQTVSLILTA